MAVDLITLAMAKKYTNEVASGMGAIKGAYKKVDGVWTLITYTYDSTKQLVYKGIVSSTSSDE